MFWQSLGVGSLINLAASNNQRRQLSAIQQRSLISLREALNELLANRLQGIEGNYEDESSLESKLQLAQQLENFVFPEERQAELKAMQDEYQAHRQELRRQLSERLAQRKDEFYAHHSLAARPSERGGLEPILNEEGQPQIVDSGETPELKVLRLKWEGERCRALVQEQDAKRDIFTSELRQRLLAFLKEHKERLWEAEIYALLLGMICNARLQALEIAGLQEAQLWLAELPPDAELQEEAKEGLAQLRQLDLEQSEVEGKSEAMLELLGFERELALYIFQCREELRQKDRDFQDILDLRASLKARGEEFIDFTEALPVHIVSCLDDLKISGHDL